LEVVDAAGEYLFRELVGGDVVVVSREAEQLLAGLNQQLIAKGSDAGLRQAREALSDKGKIKKRLAEFRVPTSITFDNEGSDIYTIIEVDTRDRLGLIYDITRALAANNVYIASAVIATFGAEAVDSFYVKDMFGLKFHSESRRKALERKLREAIDRGAERARARTWRRYWPTVWLLRPSARSCSSKRASASSRSIGGWGWRGAYDPRLGLGFCTGADSISPCSSAQVSAMRRTRLVFSRPGFALGLPVRVFVTAAQLLNAATCFAVMPAARVSAPRWRSATTCW